MIVVIVETENGTGNFIVVPAGFSSASFSRVSPVCFVKNWKFMVSPMLAPNPILILVIRDWLRVCSQTSEGVKLLSAAAE